MRRIWHVIVKEFKQLGRDPRMLLISLVPPVLQLIIFGYAANLDIKQVPVVFCDMDRTALSRDLVAMFSASEYFNHTGNADSIHDIDAYLDSGQASLAIVLPRHMARRLAQGRKTAIALFADGSDANSAVIGLNYAQQVLGRFSENILLQTLAKDNLPRVEPAVRVWYNPALKSRDFMVPSVLALLLMIMTMMLTALAIVKEKEIGTMEQLIVTPLRPFQLIVGKISPFALFGVLDILLVAAVAVFWFKVPLRGSFALLFVLCLAFLLTTLGLGILVSTITRTQQQAMMTAIFLFMSPMLFLSGFIFPIENMPPLIQAVTYLVPLRYFLVIVRGIFLKGIGMRALWDEAACLLAFGLAIISISVLRFRKRLG